MSGEVGPLAFYPVRGEEIVAVADRAASAVGVLDDLGDVVEREHRSTVEAVEGEVRPPIQDGGKPPLDKTLRLRQSIEYGAGGLRMFGFAVIDFNTSSGPAYDQEGTRTNPRAISKLNQFYREQIGRSGGLSSEETEALLERVRTEIDWLEANLDDAAAEVRDMLNHGPNERDVRTMFAAGALPSYLSVVFPDYDLNGITRTRVPSDLRHKTPDQLEEYLRNHPNARDYVEDLIRQGDLSDQEQAVIEAQARVDAQTVREAVESGDTSQDTLDRIQAGQQLLALLNEQTAHDQELSEAAHDYTHAWTNAMGAAALAALPQLISDAVYTNWNAGSAPSDAAVQSSVDSYLTPVADAILNLSKEKYYQDSDDFIEGHPVMPSAVQDLVNTRIGEYADSGYRVASIEGDGAFSTDTVANLDRLNGWSDLLAASTVDPGRDFGIDLAEQAIQAKQDANAILAHQNQYVEWRDGEGLLTLDELEAFEQLQADLGDTASNQILEVVARNQGAAADLLIDDEHRQELLGLNWDNGAGAADIIAAGTDRDGTDGTGGTELQARAAFTVMTDVAFNHDEYLDRTSEAVSDAIVDTGITWIDTFGENVNTDTDSTWSADDTDILGNQLPYSITLSSEDQEGFLRYIAGTDDPDAGRFQTASDVYAVELISGALDQDDPHVVEEALEWAGRADGQMSQANFEWAMDELGEEHDRQRAELLAENRSNAAYSTAAQIVVALPGPALAGHGGLVNETVQPLFGAIWPQHDIPDYEAMEEEQASRMLAADALDADTRRNYLLAQVALARGQSGDEYQSLLDDNGALKKQEEIANINSPNNGLDQLERLAEDPFRDWNAGQPNGSEVDTREYDAARDSTFAPVRADDGRPDGHRWLDWHDPRIAIDRLYGEDNIPVDYDPTVRYPDGIELFPVGGRDLRQLYH